jgi:hypothetical protein
MRVLPLNKLYVLEVAGIPPEDTVVTFHPGSPRLIILRHGAPDNTTFVELRFPVEAFGKDSFPDSVTVSIHPRPGIYGVDIRSSTEPMKGASIIFKYPVHFSAPIAAVAKYGGTGPYERALSVARQLGADSGYGLLPTERPASDNLSAGLTGSGTYIVAAPR